MRAQHAFGLSLSWLRVTTTFLIDIAILALGAHLPVAAGAAVHSRWTSTGLAVLVTATTLITHRRIPLTTVLAARVHDRFADPAKALSEGCTPASDQRRRYSRHVVGVREYRGRLVTVIALTTVASTTPGRRQRGPLPPTVLPAGLVVANLRQFDVRLDGIDIVSVRSGGESVAEGRGDDAAAPALPSRHETWLILRMDPMRNVEAVAVRESVAATLAAATERLALNLDEHHIRNRVLTAGEFEDVDAALLAGLQPTRIRRRRRRLKQKQRKGSRQYAATFWMSPRDITSANLERLWLPATDATAVTVRVAARHNRPQISVLVRFHSSSRLRRKASAGLNRLNGRQLTALHTSLPTPLRRMLAVPARAVGGHESLRVPLGPATTPA